MADTSTNREDVRKNFAALYASQAALQTPAWTVYDHRVDFKNQNPVALVLSGGMQREYYELGAQKWKSHPVLAVLHFVIDPQPGSGWTAAQFESTLDLMEKVLADVVKNNRRAAWWNKLYYMPSTTSVIIPVKEGGVPYHLETINVVAETTDP